MTQKLTFKNIIKHWKKIRLHRKWVRHYCFLAGIPWRGITHDLSKYSPTEFFFFVPVPFSNGYGSGHKSQDPDQRRDDRQ